MHGVEGYDFFNKGELMINEYFEVVVAEKIKIDLISVVPNSHYKSTLLIQQVDLVIQRQLFKLRTRDHT